MAADPSEWPLSELLWHRPPMVLIDRIVNAGEDTIAAELEIRRGIPFFVDESGVPAWAGLEYMAQTAAALAGVRARRTGEPMPQGLIMGCLRYRSRVAWFRAGAVLRIHVHEVAADGHGLSAFDCTIENPEPIVQSQLSAVTRARLIR